MSPLGASGRLQAAAPSLSQSSSGPDSVPASIAVHPGPPATGLASGLASGCRDRFCSSDSRAGLGDTAFFSSTVLNMGFLLLRRRASCRIPVREAGTEMRCSRDPSESELVGRVGLVT